MVDAILPKEVTLLPLLTPRVNSSFPAQGSRGSEGTHKT